ncbi:MAG: DegT/DnrJ/EryC1/StrS aminotransferase [Hyphomicrobiales bacterium]|nr:MAG: DegT/DnrJ/EryC1/StrS aminotransferase [Hyphomicrobiales bacterium]
MQTDLFSSDAGVTQSISSSGSGDIRRAGSIVGDRDRDAAVHAIEADLSVRFKTDFTLITRSWTDAAIATLLGLDISAGDEVILPAMGFSAMANAIEMVGARPVFVDVDPDTLLISIPETRRAITSQTKAVLVSHIYGQMVDLRILGLILADNPEIHILEDASHAFDTIHRGIRPGMRSTAAFLSFFRDGSIDKNEGGAILTNQLALRDAIVQRLPETALLLDDTSEMDSIDARDNLPVAPTLDSHLLSHIVTGLKNSDASYQRRLALASRYDTALANTPLRLPRSQPRQQHGHHLYPIHIPAMHRDSVQKLLGKQGIQCPVHYGSLPEMDLYKNKYRLNPDRYPVAGRWATGTLSLPLSPELTDAEQDKIIKIIKQDVIPMLLGAFN